MNDLHRIARAYYDSGSKEQRRLYKEFFESMKQDANSEVRLEDFMDFTKIEGHLALSNCGLFNKLDRNKSGGLDYYEVMTLYYIIKSGRPFCGKCLRFIEGLYFTCLPCFNHSSSPFSVCLDCYRGGHKLDHVHKREEFLDNFALLEAERKSALARLRRQNRNDRPSDNSSGQAIVRYSQSSSPAHKASHSSSRAHKASQSSSPARKASQSSSRAHEAASTSLEIVPAQRERPRLRETYRALQAAVTIAVLASNCTIL